MVEENNVQVLARMVPGVEPQSFAPFFEPSSTVGFMAFLKPNLRMLRGKEKQLTLSWSSFQAVEVEVNADKHKDFMESHGLRQCIAEGLVMPKSFLERLSG